MLHYYPHAKIKIHYLIPSTNIDDQRIMQPDWMRGMPSYIQPKVGVSVATFP